MTEPIFRYAPLPPPRGVTTEMWNLAWLTHDVRKARPYNNFMKDVESMVDVSVRIISGNTSYDRSVGSLMGLSAISAALILSKFCEDTDLVKAMGPTVRKTWVERSKLSRGDQHPINLNACIDWTFEDTTLARNLLEKYRLANNN